MKASQATDKYLHALDLPDINSRQKAQLYKNLSRASQVKMGAEQNEQIKLFYFDRSQEYIDKALYHGGSTMG